MKIKIPRDTLLPSLQHVVGAVERRQTMPALGNILLVVDKGQLSLTGTDLEVELVSNVVGEAIEASKGETTLPARKLLDICKNLPEGAELKFQVDDNRATISSGRSRFVLSTLPANEFPVFDDIKTDSNFTISQSSFLRVLEKTSFAMAQQDVRYYLNGLMLEVSDQQLRGVATDGHRLAICEESVPTSSDSKQVIVPRKGILELKRLLANNDGEVKIEIGVNHMRVVIDNLRFTSKLIDGRFPDYQRVMPADGDKILQIDRATLKQSLTRTAILSNEKYKGVRFILSAGLLKIQTQNPEQEEAEEELEVTYDAGDLDIGFNVDYLLDVLGVLEGDTAELVFKDGNSSCLIRLPDNQSARYVIMPMRL